MQTLRAFKIDMALVLAVATWGSLAELQERNHGEKMMEISLWYLCTGCLIVDNWSLRFAIHKWYRTALDTWYMLKNDSKTDSRSTALCNAHAMDPSKAQAIYHLSEKTKRPEHQKSLPHVNRVAWCTHFMQVKCCGNGGVLQRTSNTVIQQVVAWQCLRTAMHIHISPSVTTYKDGLFSAKHASSARQRNNTFECAEAVGWST